MKAHLLPYADTGMFSRLLLDYLSDREDLQRFYHRHPSSAALALQAEERSQWPMHHALLVESITHQYQGLELSPAQQDNLRSLADSSSRTVCTGHQVCLFGGPLYFVFKIASIIKLARRLSAEQSRPVVPIFWMATEDHDLAEVDHARLFGQRLEWETDQSGAVGRMTLKGIDGTIKALAELLGSGERDQQLITVLTEIYQESKTLAQATREWVQYLFGLHGILCIDADDRRLKEVFSPIMKREITEGVAVHAAKEAIEMLEHRGSKVQATPRDINLFYLTESGRHRITREGDDYRVVDTELLFSKADILGQLDARPERFSPNVIMRPVYQECLLPNLAVIGGGGELAYWLELKDVFAAFDVPYPVLMLRNSHMIIDKRSMDRWRESGFDWKDLFRPIDQLQKEYSIREGGDEVTILEEKESLLQSFDRIIAKSKVIDPTMMKFTEAEQARLKKSVETIEKKLVRAEKKKHETQLGRMESVMSKLFPGGGLQERSENVIPLLIKYGTEDFISDIIDSSDPLDMRFSVLIDQ